MTSRNDLRKRSFPCPACGRMITELLIGKTRHWPSYAIAIAIVVIAGALWVAIVRGAEPTPAPTIDVEPTYEPYTPIVATVTTEAAVYWWDCPSVRFIELDNGRTLHVWAAPGEHVLKCLLLIVDWDARRITKQEARATFTVGPSPEPEPEPDPNPTPGPSGPFTALVVLQAGDVPPSYARSLYSPRVRQWMTDNGHRLRITDPDSRDETGSVPADLVPYLGDAPYTVRFLDADNVEHGQDMWPEDEDAALELVQKWGTQR